MVRPGPAISRQGVRLAAPLRVPPRRRRWSGQIHSIRPERVDRQAIDSYALLFGGPDCAAQCIPNPAGGRGKMEKTGMKRARRTQDERSTATREALVAAAIEVVAEVGYASATTSLIARRAKVSRGALQYHFASKADLTVAIMEAIALELNFRFDLEALRQAPLRRRIEAMIEHYWDVFQGRMFRAGLSIWVVLAGDPELARRIEASMRLVREGIGSVWHDLFSDVRCAQRDLDTILHIVMATMRGSAIAFLAGRAGTDFGAERRQLADMALHAMERLVETEAR